MQTSLKLRATVLLTALVAAGPDIGLAQNDDVRSVKEYLRVALPLSSLRAQLDERVDLVEVDSVKSNNRSFEDPFGTLRGCFLFAAWDSILGEMIGVFQPPSEITLSSYFLDPSDEHTSVGFLAVADLNADNVVEIATTWGSKIYGGRGESHTMWIFSWDGASLNSVTQKDSKGFSLLRSDGLGLVFKITDVDGDGLLEILGSSGEMDENGAFSYDWDRVYSWNGLLYGSWLSTPSIQGLKFTAANNFAALVGSRTRRDESGAFEYSYSITNQSSSNQRPAFLFLPVLSDSIAATAPSGWSVAEISLRKLISFEANTTNESVSPGGTLFGFKLRSSGVPTIQTGYLQAVHDILRVSEGGWADDYLTDVQSNSVRTAVVVPTSKYLLLSTTDFLDTLSLIVQQARSIGWIVSDETFAEYEEFIGEAHRRVMLNDISGARMIAEEMANHASADSGIALSKEAYSLLRFNAEYLLERLQAPAGPTLTALTPALTLSGSGGFVLVVNGTGFVSGTQILWNGSERPTTFRSSTELSADITKRDVASPITATVTVRNPDGTASAPLGFSALTTLPQPVRPILECVTPDHDRSYTAWFGYENLNDVAVYLPTGRRNGFTPGPKDRGQPTVFLPGRKTKVFSVHSPAPDLEWTLNDRASTASWDSERCR